MSPEDDSENSIEASSATACHCVVLKAINKARYKYFVFMQFTYDVGYIKCMGEELCICTDRETVL